MIVSAMSPRSSERYQLTFLVQVEENFFDEIATNVGASGALYFSKHSTKLPEAHAFGVLSLRKHQLRSRDSTRTFFRPHNKVNRSFRGRVSTKG